MKESIARFAVGNWASIWFLVAATAIGGIYAALHAPASIFPQVNFPRVVVMADNGVMPAQEMMARVTRPIEEAMKDIPGCLHVRSATGRGSAEIDVLFSWDVNMQQSELYVLGRLAQLQSELPTTAKTSVSRMTFAAFPIVGLSLTRPGGDITRLWETARYQIKPNLLRIPGVASVEIVGGVPPEYRVTVDPDHLAALHLDLRQVADALRRNDQVIPSGLYEQDRSLYLTVVDGRLKSADDIEHLTVAAAGGTPVTLGSFAHVERRPEPSFNRVTADGTDAVLLNIYAQPDGSTLDIANAMSGQLDSIRRQLPPDARLHVFYDQSLLVRSSVRGVWDAIGFGLILSIVILYLFLRSWQSTLVAAIVIPITVLVTVLALKVMGEGLNLMTLGGIAAAVGLVIDDAIVVVEAIYVRMAQGVERQTAVREAISDIFAPLLGSTLTPVVVFVPLAFLDGITGVFFRALALTMAVALLASLALALTLTPSLAAWIIRPPRQTAKSEGVPVGGPLLRGIVAIYEFVVVMAIRHRWFTLSLCIAALATAWALYGRLDSNFLPAMDEGGFVIDYIAPAGTSLSEIDRQMRQAEAILKSLPEVESYSRRTGAALGVGLVEPNTGDFLVKLRQRRSRSTQDVIAELRRRFNIAFPRIEWDFPGILSDLIGDLTLADQPVEVRILSTDPEFLKSRSDLVEAALNRVPGVVDVLSGIIPTGPSLDIRVRSGEAAHFGLTAQEIGNAVNLALLGQTPGAVLEADRVVNIRVTASDAGLSGLDRLLNIPLRAADGSIIRLRQVADIELVSGETELHRDDLRQSVSVTAELEGRDLGSAMRDIRSRLDGDPAFTPGSLEYAGVYLEQQRSFQNLQIILGLALALVFLVALLEFRSFRAPIAIVFGASLAAFGIVAALHLTGTSLSVMTFLGAIIGMGIVHKNGILLIDYVDHLRQQGMNLEAALVYAGRRRLRPVLMTSMAAAMGMLPLAFGVGSGADMLRPLAIAVIGAVCVSVLLSLVATPTAYYIMLRPWRHNAEPARLDDGPAGPGLPEDESSPR